MFFYVFLKPDAVRTVNYTWDVDVLRGCDDGSEAGASRWVPLSPGLHFMAGYFIFREKKQKNYIFFSTLYCMAVGARGGSGPVRGRNPLCRQGQPTGGGNSFCWLLVRPGDSWGHLFFFVAALSACL